MKNSDLINFSRNIKQTEFGIKFGKKLFTNPQSLTPKQIAIALKQLGLNLPKEVVIAADLAQVLATGSAAITAVKTGKDINEITKLSASSINLFTSLANELGWVDNETAAYVSLGTDLALLVTSAGVNVQAWIGLAIDLVNVSQLNKAQAKKAASEGLSQWYSTQMKSQGQALARAFQDFQNKKIGVFGLLAQTADQSPFLWESNIKNNPTLQKLFPRLNFIPIINWNATYTASRKNLLGQVDTESASVLVRTIGEMNQLEAINWVFQWVIEPFTICYLEAEKFYSKKGLPSIFDLSLLWATDTTGILNWISDTDSRNISKAFLNTLLTPSDLGIENLFNSYYPEIEGNVYGITGALGNLFSLKKEAQLSRDQVLALDKIGDIEKLYSFSKTKKIIESKTLYPLIPPNDKVPWREASYQTFTTRGSNETYTVLTRDIQHWYGGKATDWRKLQNFISCLDYLDLVKNDPYYKTLKVPIDRISQYNIFPSIQTWKNKLAEIHGISQARKVNKMARANIAHFLGVNNSNDIKMKNKDLVRGEATTWGVV